MIWMGFVFGLGVMAAWMVLGTAVSMLWVSIFNHSRNDASNRLEPVRVSTRYHRRQGELLRMRSHYGSRYR